MKKCPSYPGYSVNENSEVFTHRTRQPIPGRHGGSFAIIDDSICKKLSHVKTDKGYLQVKIQIENINRPIGIHVLVADAYHGPKPKGMVVRHLDDNPENNTAKNIMYGTHLENATDRKINGNYTTGGNHHNAKLTNEQADKIRQLRKQKVKIKSLAALFSVSIATIETIIYNKSYKFERTDKPENFIIQRCKVCGCTDEDCWQCIEKTGQPCHWIGENLCSACAGDTSFDITLSPKRLITKQ